MLIDGDRLEEWLEEMAAEYRRLAKEQVNFYPLWMEEADLCDMVKEKLESFKVEKCAE